MRDQLPMKIISLILILSLTIAQVLDITHTDKHGDVLSSAQCNALTVIDFSFSSSDILNCTSPPCTIPNSPLSSLRFLDVLGNEMTYSLINAQFVTQTFVTGSPQAFVFQFSTGSASVYVAVPITTTNSSDVVINQQIINLNSSTDSYLAGLASITSSTLSTGISLSYFNFLNTMNYGKFYEVMDLSTSTTLLVSKPRFILPTAIPNPATTPLLNDDFSLYLGGTGDVLCWGSVNSIGFFQTHMRESVPLWFFVISVLLFWLYNLLSNENTSQIFQTSFKNNKWTCWSLYSIFYLSHQEFFTKTSRTALVLINMLWQAMVVSGIFTTVGMQFDATIIIWGTVVALAASLPVPYIYGNLVLRKVYATEKQRFKIQIQMQQHPEKARHEQLQLDENHHQEHLYALYYGYYATIIILLAVFGILCVHTMQVFPRQYYYLHNYWLATVGATIVIDLLLLDPLMTLFFGNTDFYKSRGYYYESELGELQRQLL